LLAALAAGVVSFLSPCVAPLVPGYVAFVAGDARQDGGSFRRAGGFVLGFAVVFTVLGASAASLSRELTANRSSVELLGGVIVALLGVTMLCGGLPLPSGAANLAARVRQPGTWLGAAAVGAAFAMAWSPCIGPVLAYILTIAASSSSTGWGASLLLAYSAGLAIPFLLVGLGIGRARGWSRAVRRHGRAIQVISGLVMIGTGALMAAGVMAWFSGRLAALFPALV